MDRQIGRVWRVFLCQILVVCCVAFVWAQLSTFEKRYGNADRAEGAWDIVESAGGSFVIVGATFNPKFVAITLGDADGLVMKINSAGDMLWTKRLGGSGIDIITSVIVDGRHYVMTGLTGLRGAGPLEQQCWFLKMDENGHVLQNKNFGGQNRDGGSQIIRAPDGNYLIVGATDEPYGMKKGKGDVWLLKLTPDGKMLWSRTYDLGHRDFGTSIIPFQNDKFIVTAVSCTAGCGGMFQKGVSAYLVIDSAGNVLKTVTFKQGPKNKFHKIIPAKDGGVLIVGTTSKNEKFPAEDVWVVKLDASANVSWEKTFGARGRYDGGASAFQTSDGGYLVVAYSQTLQTPQMDFDNWWLLRLDSKGELMWSRWWGGAMNDDPYAIIPTSDGGFIIAGWCDANSNIFKELSAGNADCYVVKTNLKSMEQKETPTIIR